MWFIVRGLSYRFLVFAATYPGYLIFAVSFMQFYTVIKKILAAILLLAVVSSSIAQDSSHLNKKRLWIVSSANVGLISGSLIALNSAWYKDYPRTSFHFFNDNDEWLQMDKCGHVWTTYNISRFAKNMWSYTGMKEKHAVILGGVTGIAYQGVVEVLDGFSSEWGFSWGDMGANFLGAGAYVSQQLLWKDQRIQIKMSYWPYDYESSLIARRDQVFGSSLPERVLKDYNSQTYWLSGNIRSFFPRSKIPEWLCLSFGYGADGMLGARSNVWTDKQGNSFDRSDIPRIRRYFLSVDVDLTKIRTKSKFLKTTFSILNMVKIPAPALELDSKGKFSFHALYF